MTFRNATLKIINFPILKQDNGNNSLKSVEMLRGIASFMVCYFHVVRGNPLFISHDNWMCQFGRWGWTGVNIFFVISGFIIPYSMFKKGYTIKQINIFLKKRIIRIEPPYIVSIFIVIILTYLSALSSMYQGSSSIDWLNVLSHVGYINVFTGKPWLNGVYWTLAIEFQFYILVAMLYPFITSVNLYTRQITILGLLALSFLPIPSVHIFPNISYFIIGISFFLYFCKRIGTLELFEYTSICFLLLFNNEPWWLSILCILTGIMIVQIDRVPKIFLKLGMISYSLYLIHMPIEGKIVNIAERFVENLHLRMFIALLAVFLCILSSYFFYIIIEKRFKQLSAKILYK